jgi:predicted HD phosphohydrolase
MADVLVRDPTATPMPLEVVQLREYDKTGRQGKERVRLLSCPTFNVRLRGSQEAVQLERGPLTQTSG